MNYLFVINYNSDAQVYSLLVQSDLSCLNINSVIVYSNGANPLLGQPSHWSNTLSDLELTFLFGENKGYAAAINHCIAWARSHLDDAQMLFFSNADIVIHPGTNESTYPCALYDVCGFPVYQRKFLVFDKIYVYSPLVPVSLSKYLARFRSPSYGLSQIVHGSLFAIRMDFLSSHRLCLSEDYFLYWEELDFCYRAGRCGAKIGVSDEVSVVHDGEKAGSLSSARYFMLRNGLYFYSSIFRPMILGYLLAFLWLASNVLYLPLALLREQDIDWFVASLKDFLFGIRGPRYSK